MAVKIHGKDYITVAERVEHLIINIRNKESLS